MQTEFTCGIFRANLSTNIKTGPEWLLSINMVIIATIDVEDKLMHPTTSFPSLTSSEELIEIAVLMNNIKRQYKQLQTT